ncbi:MAG: Maf family protein [Gammaproteobacteria bacterium]|nr:Maf family protein [Gammaproteobacteria bacterium]
MQTPRQLILGSSSKPRQALLQRLQLPFEIAAPDVDETPLPNETPSELVYRLAEIKARAVALKYPDALIITADQVGVLDNQILGKPLTHKNAIKQLQQASGKRMQFFIGLCLLDARNQTQQIALETFDVLYRKLTPDQIQRYLKKEQPLECAGSCKAEGLGIALIEEFQGKDFSALIGLPLIRLVSMLEAAGLSPLA